MPNPPFTLDTGVTAYPMIKINKLVKKGFTHVIDKRQKNKQQKYRTHVAPRVFIIPTTKKLMNRYKVEKMWYEFKVRITALYPMFGELYVDREIKSVIKNTWIVIRNNYVRIYCVCCKAKWQKCHAHSGRWWKKKRWVHVIGIMILENIFV